VNEHQPHETREHSGALEWPSSFRNGQESLSVYEVYFY